MLHKSQGSFRVSSHDVPCVTKKNHIIISLFLAIFILFSVGCDLVMNDTGDGQLSASFPQGNNSPDDERTTERSDLTDDGGYAPNSPYTKAPDVSGNDGTPVTVHRDDPVVPDEPISERIRELIPHFDLRYFLSALSDSELEVVYSIYNSAVNFESDAYLPVNFHKDDFFSMWSLLNAECPELFNIDFHTQVHYFYDPDTGYIDRITIPYLLDKDEYSQMLASVGKVSDYLKTATDGMTDVEKEKVVFDYMAINCRYDTESDYSATAYGALVSKSAKCHGISLGMKWMLEELGIQCLCITADCLGEDIGHAWNIVRIDGEYYTVDLTQSVQNSDNSTFVIEGVVYCAFNISDSWTNNNYFIHDFFSEFAPIPSCSTNENSYYAKLDCFVFRGDDPESVLARQLETIVKNGGGNVYLHFENESEFEDFVENVGTSIVSWFSENGESYSSARYVSCAYNLCAITINI